MPGFLAAEDAALRHWLNPKHKDFDEPQLDNVEHEADAGH
jgi:hypothetical protein